MKRPICLLMLSAALAGGCTVGPDYVPPKVQTPARWSEDPVRLPKHADYRAWWKTFNDPALDILIDEALANNLDLKQARQRIRSARAQRTQTVAAGLPTLSGRSTASRRLNSISSPTGSAGASGGGTFGIGKNLINIFQSGFDAQWELDLFGGIRRTVEAAEANTEVEIENRRALMVSLLAEIASQYITLRANQQLDAISRENLALQRSALQLTQERQQAGLVSELDVAQAQALVDSTAAGLPVYEAQVKLALHAISVLLNRPPGGLTLRFNQTAPIPLPDQAVAADLPSELLRRRPDIRRAERQLAAANAEIGVAVAAQYPRINLAAFVGLQNTDITDFTVLGKSWSMASTLAFPIVNWGSIKANIEAKKARYEELIYAYQAAVLNAFKEVEDALAAIEQEQQRLAKLQKALSADRLVFEIAQERYRKGLTAFLDVLSAEQTLSGRRQVLIESQAKLAGQRVVLYKALGGGWQIEKAKEQSSENSPTGG